jgi:hypothetical protein
MPGKLAGCGSPSTYDILSSLKTCTVDFNALEPPAPHDKINPRARSLDVLTVGEQPVQLLFNIGFSPWKMLELHECFAERGLSQFLDARLR